MSKNINAIFLYEKTKTTSLPNNFKDLKSFIKNHFDGFDNFDIFYKKNGKEEIKIDNDENYRTYTSSNENLKLFIREIGTVLQEDNEKDNLNSIKESLQLENNDNKTKNQTCVISSQKNKEQNNLIEKKTEEYKNIIKQKEILIEKINGEKKELEKKIEEKNNIIQQIFNAFIKINNTINIIGSIYQPSNNNQNIDMNNIINQISNDGINNTNIVNNIFQTISNNIFSELNKIRNYIMNNLNNNNINQNIMNNVNNHNNKINKKNEYTGNEKKREKDKIFSLIQSKTEFKTKTTKNLPYSCVLRQDRKYQDISFDNLNPK